MMKSVFASYKYHLSILAIAICWLALLSQLLQLNSQDAVFNDSKSYIDAASLLYNKFNFHYYRPCLMAFINGFPYAFGYSDAAVYRFGFYVNVGCWLGTSLILHQMLLQFLSGRIAFMLTIGYIFIVGSALLVFHLLTESLFAFFMIVAFYFMMRYYKNRSFRNLAIALNILLLSILIKPGSQFFVLICFTWHIRILIKNYSNPALVFVVGSLMLISIQLSQMKKAYGDYTISYISGVTYYNYLGAKAAALKNGVGFGTEKNERQAYIFTLSMSEQNRVAATDLKDQVRNNKFKLMKSYFSNVYENMRTPSDCISVCRNVNRDNYFESIKYVFTQISKWQNRILSALGVGFAIICLTRFKSFNPAYSFMSLYILSVVFLSGLSCYQGDRFHVIFYPFTILLTAKILFGKTKSAPTK